MEDKLADVDRLLGRRERLRIVALVAEVVIGVVLGGLLTAASHFEGWFLISTLAVALGTVPVMRGFGMGRKPMLNFLRQLGSHVRDFHVPRFGPLFVVLDNGLGLRPMGPMCMAWLFFSFAGEVLVPNAVDAQRWLKRPWRLRRIGFVGPRHGPMEARAELNSLQSALGIKITGAGIQERRPEDLMKDPTGPHWIGFTVLSSFRGIHRVPTIARDLGAVSSFLDRLRDTYSRQPRSAGLRG